MYRLELETLLLVLRERSGQLEAWIQNVPGLKGRCRALIILVNGKIVSCTLSNQQGQTLSGEQALQVVQKKVLEWTYQEQQPPAPTVVGNPPIERSPILPPQLSPRRQPASEPPPRPRAGYARVPIQAALWRAASPPPYLVQSWTRLQRSVFMLIDGTHSIATIAHLLRQDEATIMMIVTEMINLGIVRL